MSLFRITEFADPSSVALTRERWSVKWGNAILSARESAGCVVERSKPSFPILVSCSGLAVTVPVPDYAPVLRVDTLHTIPGFASITPVPKCLDALRRRLS